VWEQPGRVELFSEQDRAAVVAIQKVVRGFVHRMRVRQLVVAKYSRFYDSGAERVFWVNKATQKSYWG
jgi:hypothetical protein